jgi:hypothetical protein
LGFVRIVAFGRSVARVTNIGNGEMVLSSANRKLTLGGRAGFIGIFFPIVLSCLSWLDFAYFSCVILPRKASYNGGSDRPGEERRR